jgi:peroxiredoxin
MSDTTRTLKVGERAPDFQLKGTNRTEFKLGDYRGKNVVLNFFPAAFSPVCSNQMPRIQSEQALFGGDTVVVGVSVDGTWSLDAFARQAGVDFPILSDFYPHGAVSEKYGVLLPNGVSERAVIGIDKEGIVRYIDVHPILEIPELGACAEALSE